MADDSDGANLVLFTVGIIAAIMAGWVLANFEPQRTGNVLLGLVIVGFICLLFGIFADDLLGLDDDSEGPEITKGELLTQTIVGFFGGLIPIVISIVAPTLTMSLPLIANSVVNSAVVSIFFAPIIEEFAFLCIAMALYKIVYKATGSRALAIVAVFLIVSPLFAVYHWWAYGGSALVGGAFLGAAVFRFLTLLVIVIVSATGDGEIGFSPSAVAAGIIITVLMHFDFNTFVFGRSLSVVGV